MKRAILIIFIIGNYFHISFSQQDLPEIISRTEKAVCLIETFDDSGNPLMRGTGFFIDKNGTCVSNYHVIKGSSDIKVTTIDKRIYKVKEIIKSSGFYDLVVFNLVTDSVTNFLSVNNTLPLKGESIITIGNPEGLNWSVSEGIISSIRQVEGGNILQITAPISSGNSGSPVLNKKGEVIGIASFKLLEGENLNFAVHVSILDSIKTNTAIFEDINEGGKIKITLPNDFKIASSFIDTLIFIRNRLIADEAIDSIYDVKVLEYIDDFIKKYPNSSYGYSKKAEFFIKNSDYLKAYSLLTKAIAVEPNNPENYLKRGKFISGFSFVFTPEDKIGKLKTALSDFIKYGSFSKDNLINSYYVVGKFYSINKEPLKAIDFYTKYINDCNTEGKSVDAEVYFDRGISYQDLNNFQKAYDDLEKIVILKPDCTHKIWLANFLFSYDKYAEASPYLSDECLFYEGDYYKKSFVLYKIGGDLVKAKLLLNRALKNYGNPENDIRLYSYQKSDLENYLRLSAILNEKTNNPIQALIDLNRIFKNNTTLKDDYNFCLWLAESKFYVEDYIGALKDINLLVEKRPKEAYLFFRKGITLTKLNDYTGSIKSFNIAIELAPKEGQYYSMRGWSKYFNNDKSGSCDDWSKAGELGFYAAYDYIKEYCNK